MKITYWNTKEHWYQFCIDDKERCITIYSKWTVMNWENTLDNVKKLAKHIKEAFILEESETGSTREARDFIYKEYGI